MSAIASVIWLVVGSGVIAGICSALSYQIGFWDGQASKGSRRKT